MSLQNIVGPNFLDQIKKLSILERVQLVENIWDSIAVSAVELPLTDDQKQDLDKRLDAFENNPDDGSAWPNVKKRIESKL